MTAPSGRRRGRFVPLVLLALLLAAATTLAVAAPAAAHTGLEQSTPREGARLTAFPATARLRFADDVVPDATVLRLTGPGGSVPLGRVSSRGAVVVVGLPRTARPGAYRLDWRVVSVDGHPVEGSIHVRLLAAPVRSAAAAPTVAPAAGPSVGSATPTGAATVAPTGDASVALAAVETSAGRDASGATGSVPAWAWFALALGGAVLAPRLLRRRPAAEVRP